MIKALKKINQKNLIKRINNGEIIIFPTDVEYCIGCNALNEESVALLRELSNSNSTLTILPQSKQWIHANLKSNKLFIRKLPGPFVYILNLKAKSKKKLKNATNTSFIAIRIPNHKLTKIIQKTKKPFIIERITHKKTRSLKNISKTIKDNVDLIIDDGDIEDKPFSILDLREKITKIVVR